MRKLVTVLALAATMFAGMAEEVNQPPKPPEAPRRIVRDNPGKIKLTAIKESLNKGMVKTTREAVKAQVNAPEADAHVGADSCDRCRRISAALHDIEDMEITALLNAIIDEDTVGMQKHQTMLYQVRNMQSLRLSPENRMKLEAMQASAIR